MLTNDFTKEPIDSDSIYLMVHPRLRHALSGRGIQERKEIARRRLQTILKYAMQDKDCFLDVRIVSEIYPELIPEILRASSFINKEEKLHTAISPAFPEYKDFIEEIKARSISKQVGIQEKELRGSRIRCIMLTSMPREYTAKLLTDLVEPFSVVMDNLDFWMPRGFKSPEEAELSKNLGFLNAEQRKCILQWWLKKQKGAKTPNWDLVSTCSIDQRKGLILVEAKSYDKELKENDSCGATNPENLEQISTALNKANLGLNTLLPGWALEKLRCYQISNRFAWVWKLADMGIPVILVYLGFVNAHEMVDRGQPFRTNQNWRDSLLNYSNGIVPTEIWDKRWEIKGTPFIPLIRTVNVDINARIIK